MTEPAPAPKNEKPKVAFYWCASCGGCEETVLDLDERVLDVVAAVDIVFWPVALDFKRHDVEAMPDGSILAAFVNGAGAAASPSSRNSRVSARRTAPRIAGMGPVSSWSPVSSRRA